MSRLLDGLDKILDDSFFDELMSLDIDEDDCSLTLNQFLGIQSEENYDVLFNDIVYQNSMKLYTNTKETEEKINSIHSNMWLNFCSFFWLVCSFLHYDDLIKYSDKSDKNDELLHSYIKSFKMPG